MVADNKEQRVCMKFCFLLGKSAAQTVLMLQEAFKGFLSVPSYERPDDRETFC